MNRENLVKILGREPYSDLVNFKLDLPNDTILVTGGKGSIGQLLIDRINCKRLILTDIDDLDVTDEFKVASALKEFNPSIIIHLAASKYAPEGEEDSMNTFKINAIGTNNIIKYKPENCKIVLASTCKACNPETVYGASKLIAERLVLNSGGNVARFFNVVETQGNVFELWEKQEVKKVATLCNRYFVSVNEAVGLILYTCTQDKGRYIINTDLLRKVTDIFKNLYGDETYKLILPRRGDRLTEKFKSENEHVERYLLNNSVIKMANSHD